MGDRTNYKYLIQQIKLGNTKEFYYSYMWKKKRKQILRRDNHECQRCKDNGWFHRAEVVHHREHLKDKPERCLDDDNLISLCFRCHNEVHPEKQHKMVKVVEKKKLKYNNIERW